MANSNVTLEYKETVRKQYETEGLTLKQLSVMHNVTPATVANYVREAGGELRPRGRRTGVKIVKTDNTVTANQTVNVDKYNLDY